MKVFNKLLLCAVTLIFLSFTTAATYAKKPHKVYLDKISLYLKWSHQAQFAGYYFADKAGFYQERKLKVKIRPGILNLPTSIFIRKVVRTPNAFGIASADQLLIARAHHIPVVAVATIYQLSPCVILSLKASNITKPAELIGKKIGIQYGTDSELIYRAIMNAAGIDRKRVTEIPMQTYDDLQYLQNSTDAIMAYSINESVALKEKRIETSEITPISFGINFYSDVLFTSERMVENHPELVRKFVQASLEGWNAALADPNQAVKYTLEYNSALTSTHEKNLLEASIPFIKNNTATIGSMDAEKWNSMQDVLLKQHFYKRPINIGEVFTTEFLN